jgi:hypothetical protein
VENCPRRLEQPLNYHLKTSMNCVIYFGAWLLIDQGNASAIRVRLPIPRERSLLAEIVDEKILNDNKDLPDDRPLKRIL